jgi:hypothetical protein
MNQEVNPRPNQNSEEIDLIRLFNYFKNGIKSIFRAIGKLFELIIVFIILLKKNWILVLGLVALGAIFGKFILPVLSQNSSQKYEMVVRTNPIANYELYSYAVELNNPKMNPIASKEVGFEGNTKINGMNISPIPKLEDEIQNYFQQIENGAVRGFETDTLYFHNFEIKGVKNFLDDKDYPLQKIVFYADENIDTKKVQDKFVNYFNNLGSIKNEQQSRYNALTLLERKIQTDLNAIDSIMFSRAAAAKNTNPATSEQVLVNTASRSNVEGEILYMSEKLTKKLYGIQKLKNDAERGVSVISSLRISEEKNFFSNQMYKYMLFGFIAASLIILGIQFNKYLEKVAQKKSL